ncbi:hypothetical protein HDU98_001840 [Podochytrium sp. JEL0797]|nr:hypothetical protein HDU98_001840 [Podochytrium sp. JEL0797]
MDAPLTVMDPQPETPASQQHQLEAILASPPSHSDSLPRTMASIEPHLNDQNPQKHDTPLMSLPPELVGQILLWIPPQNAWRLRGLSKSFQKLVSSTSFARVNVLRFVAPPSQNRVALVDCTGYDRDWWTSHDDWLYAHAPMPYQTAFIQCFIKDFKFLVWDGDDGAIRFWSGFPVAVFECKHLVIFGLYWQDCIWSEMEIPDCFGSLVSLECLNMVGNNFTGVIPASIGMLKKLKELDLSSNCLEGPIPEELGECRNLEDLDLSCNQFGGTLPCVLMKLAKLRRLNVCNCGFVNPIPVMLIGLMDCWDTNWLEDSREFGFGVLPWEEA